MTSGIPRHLRSGPPSARTAPTVRIDLAALDLNLRAVLSNARTGIIDVRADAWGHGAGETARAALDAGAAALLVDDAGAAALARTVDARRLVNVGEADAAEAVYGLTDGFTPVLSLHGKVLSLKVLRAGEGVSYGYSHRAVRDTTVALVTGGYAQGVVRALGNAAHVSIRGRRLRLVGRVAMDVCVVDVGPAGDEGVVAGDAVVFFGGGPSAPALREWTDATGLSAGELVTAVGVRADREYVR